MPALTTSGLPNAQPQRVNPGMRTYDPGPSSELMAQVYLQALTMTQDVIHIQSAGNHLWKLLRVDKAIRSRSDQAQQDSDASSSVGATILANMTKYVGSLYTTDTLCSLAGLAWIAIYTPGADCANLIPPTNIFLRLSLMDEEYGISDPYAKIIFGNMSHYVAISYWFTGAGGFGHIGIAVDSEQTEGFSTRDPKMSKLKRIIGMPVAGVENDINAHRSKKTLKIAPNHKQYYAISAESARAMKIVIERRRVDPGSYNLLLNNCARFVEDVLRAGKLQGVPHAEIFGPAILGGALFLGGIFRRKREAQ